MAKDTVMLCVSLSDEEAGALATFFHRAAFSDYREFLDGPDQTYDMVHAAARVLDALSGAGYGD